MFVSNFSNVRCDDLYAMCWWYEPITNSSPLFTLFSFLSILFWYFMMEQTMRSFEMKNVSPFSFIDVTADEK